MLCYSAIGLGTPTTSTIVATEWHTLFLQSDLFEILGGFSDMHTLDGLGSFKCVLKVEPLDLHDFVGFFGSSE